MSAPPPTGGSGAAGGQPERLGILYARGSTTDVISDAELALGLKEALAKAGVRRKVLLLPPDITRLMSKAGTLACAAYEHYGDAMTDVMPTLGTHRPMTDEEIAHMYPAIPPELFREHDWRRDTVPVGEVPAEAVSTLTGGKITGVHAKPWVATLNRLVAEGGHDLVLSVGQVVPHEALGMASFTKNLFIGAAGADTINHTHHICAVHGVENVMGRWADNPGRHLFQLAYDEMVPHLPALFAMTVRGPRNSCDGAHELVTRGLFVGDTAECFTRACELSLAVNVTLLAEAQRKVVCYLDPAEYKSMWVANKAIYRTRLAVADGGELVVLAPGVKVFASKPPIDTLIRRYGYVTTPELLAAAETDVMLQENLVAAAHMMLSSSEGRFTVRYCPPSPATAAAGEGGLSKEDIERASFEWGDLAAMMSRYDPQVLSPGTNTMPDGEEIFFVPAPGSGLWATRDRFSSRNGGGSDPAEGQHEMGLPEGGE